MVGGKMSSSDLYVKATRVGAKGKSHRRRHLKKLEIETN